MSVAKTIFSSGTPWPLSTEIARAALPPVAHIGSINNTLRFATSAGSLT